MQSKFADKVHSRYPRAQGEDSGFTPSLLDRLLDDAPAQSVDSIDACRVNIFIFKAALARDLASLLNSRCIDIDKYIEQYPLAQKTMVAYGIEDLSSLSLLDPSHRALLRDRIRMAIERFEPRLTRVRVTLETSQDLERKLRFRVDAVLRVHPVRPPVTFDAWLNLSSSQYHFKETA
jgi:type VI secretion system protein ImpF